jgi:hypothetical protein
MFSALLFGHGGQMLTEDERDVAFNGAEGLAALRLLDRMVKEGQMPNYAGTADLQAFAAGRQAPVSQCFKKIGAPWPVVGSQPVGRARYCPRRFDWSVCLAKWPAAHQKYFLPPAGRNAHPQR